VNKHVIAAVDELPPGSRKRVELDGREIVVFNVDGEYFALLDRCPHQQASLYHGVLTGYVESTEPGQYSFSRQGEIIRCPWHGWEFDLRTGKSCFDPAKMKTKTFKVEVECGMADSVRPCDATTFAVSVEAQQVVVHT